MKKILPIIFMVFQAQAMEQLPDDVKIEQYHYLGPKELGRCAQVCKNWNRISSSDRTWKECTIAFPDLHEYFYIPNLTWKKKFERAFKNMKWISEVCNTNGSSTHNYEFDEDDPFMPWVMLPQEEPWRHWDDGFMVKTPKGNRDLLEVLGYK